MKLEIQGLMVRFFDEQSRWWMEKMREVEWHPISFPEEEEAKKDRGNDRTEEMTGQRK